MINPPSHATSSFLAQRFLFTKLVKYTLIEAFFNRLLLLTFIAIGLIILGSHFVGLLAITEHQKVILSLQGGAVRLTIIFLTTLFVITSLQREINDKHLAFIFSTTVSRGCYLFAKLFGFMLISLFCIVMSCFLLLLRGEFINVVLWGVSLFFETAIVIALSLVMLTTFNSTPGALFFVAIFYWAGRVIQAIQLMANNPILDQQTLGQVITLYFINGLAFFLPTLSDFTQTDWLIYEAGSLTQLGGLILQSLIYVSFLISIALIDLHRKNIG